MNNCRNIAADLSAFADGELPAARRAEVEAHVAGCPACRARLAELRQLAAGLAAMPQAQPDPRFLTGVRSGLRGQPRETGWRVSWISWPVRVAALAVIVIGLLAIFMLSPRFHGREDETPKLAKAEAPAEVAQLRVAPAAPDSVEKELKKEAVRSPAVEDNPAPTLVTAKLGSARTDGLDRDEAKTATGFELADAPAMPAETIVVESLDMKQVQSDAAHVANTLNGRINFGRSVSNNFYVELPARNAGSFRSQLLNQNSIANRRQFNSEPSGALKAAVAAGSGAVPTNEPVSVLEIQVVPPKR